MSQNKSFFDRFFPDTDLHLVSGTVQESGTGATLANGKYSRERWIKVNEEILIGADETLYQSAYGQLVHVAADTSGRVIAYVNATTGMSSQPSQSSAIGAIAAVILLTAIAYFGGIWNFIWKGFDIWWLTILIITLFSLYAVLWTPIFVYKEMYREKHGHQLVASFRKS